MQVCKVHTSGKVSPIQWVVGKGRVACDHGILTVLSTNERWQVGVIKFMGPWGCESSIGQSRVVAGNEKQTCQWDHGPSDYRRNPCDTSVLWSVMDV